MCIALDIIANVTNLDHFTNILKQKIITSQNVRFCQRLLGMCVWIGDNTICSDACLKQNNM